MINVVFNSFNGELQVQSMSCIVYITMSLSIGATNEVVLCKSCFESC